MADVAGIRQGENSSTALTMQRARYLDARLRSVYSRDISQTLLHSLQVNLITFTLVVEFEQAEALPIAEDEANCVHPHLF